MLAMIVIKCALYEVISVVLIALFCIYKKELVTGFSVAVVV